MKPKSTLQLMICSCMLTSAVLPKFPTSTENTTALENSTKSTRRVPMIGVTLQKQMTADMRHTEIEQRASSVSKEALVVVTIRDAECYSSHTQSSFVVYLTALDFDDTHLSHVYIRSDKFVYDDITATHTFSGKLVIDYPYHTLDECFDDGYIDCVPRADVVYIRFEAQPDDPWAIDHIDVDVTFQLAPGDDSRYTWHFEHTVLLPCVSWIDQRKVYQIGPRTGLFLEHDYSYTPVHGTLAEDWSWVRD